MKIPILTKIVTLSAVIVFLSGVSVLAQSLNVTIDNQTAVCGNSPSGSFEAIATGGTAPYSFAWYNSSWGIDNIMQGMQYGSPKVYGTFHVIVTDYASGKDTATVTISASPLSMTASAVMKSYGAHAGCDINDGEIEIEINGGTPPYLVKVRWNVGYDAAVASGFSSDTIFEAYTSASEVSVDSLFQGGYEITVTSDSGTTCVVNSWVQLNPPYKPLVKFEGELYSNGFYTSCDTCSDGNFTIKVIKPHGEVIYNWLEFPEEFNPDVFFHGTTAGIHVDFKEGHSPSYIDESWVVYSGSDSVYNQLEADKWYVAYIVDSLGCEAYQQLKIEKPYVPFGTWASKGNESDSTDILGTTNAEALRLASNDTVRMEILPSGQVGIGTSEVPSGYLLAVNGKAIMEEVEVKLQGDWPDFVFEEKYYLPPLDSVKKFINLNGHLPGMPSAKTMQERGSIASGQMTISLVQKVEELTLYILELQRRVEILEQQNEGLFRHIKETQDRERIQRNSHNSNRD